MAFRTKKISQMDPKGANLASTDLIEISQLVSGSYVTKSITGAEITASAPAAAWGTITGTLSSQTDLNTALSGKQATVTLTTTGTSGASTFVANTLNVPTYSLSGLGGVPTSRTLTINGTTQDLSADRTFTISTGITIGTTAITSGTVGRVLFEGTGNVVQESAGLFWDNTNKNLGIGGTPSETLDVKGSATSGFNAISFKSQYTSVGYLGGDNSQIFMSSSPSGAGSSISLSGTNASFAAVQNLRFFTSGAERARIAITTGNVLINTTTDAGFKLDVNGTARVTMGASAEFRLGTSGGLPAMLYSGGGYMMRWKNDASELYLQGTSFMVMRNNTQEFVMQPNSTYLSSGTFAVNTSTIIASAILQADSTTKGFLPPRMTTTQKNAIATPATGLVVYDTTLNRPCFFDGTTWITL
jgi:hypothetical protein